MKELQPYITIIPAWWGAGLSTLLALIKIWEIWKDRFRIEINFLDDSDETAYYFYEEINIFNFHSKPIFLERWDILIGQQKKYKRNIKEGPSIIDSYEYYKTILLKLFHMICIN